MTNEQQTENSVEPTKRHYVRVVAFVVLGVSLAVLLMYEAYPYLRVQPIVIDNRVQNEDDHTDVLSTSTPVFSLSRSEPVQLRIPKLSVDTTFEEPIGLNEDKTIQVPDSYEQVGWYKYGASPGEIGTAIILGHVDSYEGAAIFYHLGELEAGDKILVTRADGTEAEFVVEYLERYLQSEFPTEKVYGKTEYPELRLITCSGKYEKGTQRYTHNLVVYARLVEQVNENGVE